MTDRQCWAEGCGLPARTLGLCPKHYRRKTRNGHVGDTYWCSVQGCPKRNYKAGLCRRHLMPDGDPQCVVCTHPKLLEINRLLIAGAPTTDVASAYDLYREGPSKHSISHLGLKRPHSGPLCTICLMPDAETVERDAGARGYKAAAAAAGVSAATMRRHMVGHAGNAARAAAYAAYEVARLNAARRLVNRDHTA